jgi:hypothetical protein
VLIIVGICVAFEVTNLGMEGVQSKRLECVGFVMMMLTKMQIMFLDRIMLTH